ncbi:MAG: T9SS type A sorting domain-containing protein, partial [Rhodothermaceae bacterium]|nr:T9SS type A sorting domain-containing protein [Rhodothermaceae bacterium]
KKQHGNVIGYNDIGIQIWGDYNRIKGNYIGVTEDGQAISNNTGIHLTGFSNGPTNVTAYYNQVGYQPEASIDPQAENANTIAHNNNEGILAQEVVGSVNLPLYNSIRGNHIYDNGGSGIDLYGTPGSDANDTIDGDIGANFLLNYPDIVRVDYNASFDAIGIEYSISSSPAIVNYPLTVDAYLADDPASGEGKTYIGSSTYTTQNSIQLLAIDASSITWSPTDVIVLTTTDGDGNTSEFSLASAEIGGPGHTVSAFNESARPALKTSNPFTLSAPYPNPFRHQSTFTITTDEEGPIRIALFDILGREVRALFEGNLQKGSPASFSIESQNLPNGTYWIRAETSHRSLVRSVILSR